MCCGWVGTGCVPDRYGWFCPRWVSRSASRRWSPSSASPPPVAPNWIGYSMLWAPTCSPSVRAAGCSGARRSYRRTRSRWWSGSGRPSPCRPSGASATRRSTAATRSRPPSPVASAPTPPAPTCPAPSAPPSRPVPGSTTRPGSIPPWCSGPERQIWLGGRWFTVVGILNPVPLAPELDMGALIGWPAAQRYLDFDGRPTTIYTRADPERVELVRGLLARTANPAQPNEVNVSRPSDALAAQAAAKVTFTGLLLGLGAVALLVGGIGVANTMVIAVLERRAEIGLRRSFGATRGQIRNQFLAESVLLSTLGGGTGVLLGSAVTATYASLQRWPTVVPAWVMGGAVTAAVLIGALAGLYPAIRAARLAPTEALATI